MIVHLICPKTKEMIVIGKILPCNGREDSVFWWSGLSDEQLGHKILWFLADHVGDNILILNEHDVDRMEDLSEYIRVDDKYGDSFNR